MIETLPYHPPFQWLATLHFLQVHLLKGVEWIENQTYFRTVQWDDLKGWLKVENDSDENRLKITLSDSLHSVSSLILDRLKDMFDLHIDPQVIIGHFLKDKYLASCLKATPGLRITGTFQGFELAVRAILGQQISVKAATTLAGRIIEKFGEPFLTPYPCLTHISPQPNCLAETQIKNLAVLGIIQNRARSIIKLSQEILSGAIILKSNSSSELTLKNLLNIPGIGPWTAQYIAMRALRCPDAFLKEDIAIRSILGGVTPHQAEIISENWRPWRSYATLYLWHQALQKKIPTQKRIL